MPRREMMVGLMVLALAAMLVLPSLSVSRAGEAPSGDGVAARGDEAGPGASGRVIIADDLGRKVAVTLPLSRVVVLNRYDVEFVRAVAGTAVIAGIDTEITKAPAYWRGLSAAVVGQGQQSLDYEAIVSLRPDAVLLPRNGDWERTARALEPFGIPVIVLTGWDVLKHEENVTLLGRLFGRPAEAEALNAFYRRYRTLLESRLRGVSRKKVYLEEVRDNRTVLKGSGWHDMIELAGGINLFGDLSAEGQPARRGNVQSFDIDPEQVLARRPDIIVKLEPSQYEPVPAAQSRAVLESIAGRPGFSLLPAVDDGRVYHMSYYLAGGCSKIIGALQIAKWLYPDRMTDIDPEAVMREWLERFQHVPSPGGFWTSLAGDAHGR